jgi:asparagine synthase (glutamine-hydrolysing)
MTATDRWFFLALPDDDAAAAILGRALPDAEVLASHASGRPWLLGRVPAGRIVVHVDGPHRLALVGATSATAATLGRVADHTRSAADLAGVSRRFPGSYCLVGSLDGRLYCQGSAVGTHRVFHAVLDGVRVVSDRADVLADLGALSLSLEALALRLVRSLPHPLQETPLWPGVRAVAPADYILVDRDGRRWETGTWWHRPQPQLSRAEGAGLLRAALDAAVSARITSGEPIGCDLSGGMDSTPLCWFAARATDVIARTAFNDDPGGRQDLDWARVALRGMPGVHRHVTESTEEMPPIFSGLLEMRDRLDEPTQALLAGPRITHALRAGVAAGAAVHLNGLGGDHLLCGVGAYEHALMRTRPFLAWRRARALHLADGRPARETIRQLADRTPYRTWLRRSLARALTGAPGAEFPDLADWWVPPSLPGWLSVEGRAAVAAAFDNLADAGVALGPDRAAHAELMALRDGARVARGIAQFGHRAGAAYDAPLLDDHIAEVVLSVRREERVTPLEWKPLMKEAMRGLLPDEFLRRTTKTGGATQQVRGLAAHRTDLLKIFDRSGLAASGLVDMAALTRATRPELTAVPDPHLGETVNTALFLLTRAGSRTAHGTAR